MTNKINSFYIIKKICVHKDTCTSSSCHEFSYRDKRIAINDYLEIGRFAIKKLLPPDTQTKKTRILLINNETQCRLYAREFIEKGYIRSPDGQHYYKIRESTRFENKILKRFIPKWIKSDSMNIYDTYFSLNTIIKFVKKNYQYINNKWMPKWQFFTMKTT